jgi:metallo-beta-lactamase class B
MRYTLVCLLFISVALSAQNRILSDEARANLHGPSSQPIEPFRLVGNVYYVGARNIASHLITTPEGHILIDTGTKEMEAVVPASIEKLGFQLRDVKIILSTQAHFDHVGAHAALKKRTGAQVMAIGDEGPHSGYLRARPSAAILRRQGGTHQGG